MKKLILISTYFGSLPSYFKLWLKTAEKNSDVDFFIYSDCEHGNLPKNVKIIPTSFDDIKKRVQSKFDFKIKLSTPYKLCDYKPAYGYIFEEDIKPYEYWGHFDLDTMLGRLTAFLPDKKYEKIYSHGHLCIYRNTYENNRRFMLDGGMSYKDAFTTDNILVFDETNGIQIKYNLLNIETYNPRCFADISRHAHKFGLVVILPKPENFIYNYGKQVFYYENSAVYRSFFKDGKIESQEFNYIHFSSRKMPIHFENAESFFITPDGFFEKTKPVCFDDFEKYNYTNEKLEKKAQKAYKKWRIKRKINKITTSFKEKII